MSDLPWPHICRQISESTGERAPLELGGSVRGGCINEAYRLRGAGCDYFVKLSQRDRGLGMFEAEALGLREIDASRSVRVPRVICWGNHRDCAWLILEFLSMGHARAGAEATLGEQLARMHACTSQQFGWFRDNTIGATPQPNPQGGDWPDFYARWRLAHQLELARQNGYTGRLQTLGERLLERVGCFFSDYRPLPSLLHGDLWSGNVAFSQSGEPLLFDPATYHGDREADIAMTELFGGFSSNFYCAYRQAWPLDAGYGVRRGLYNLYHVLNHLNLFGGAYGRQAERMLEALLAEVR